MDGLPDLDALLTLLRTHGVTAFEGLGFKLVLAPRATAPDPDRPLPKSLEGDDAVEARLFKTPGYRRRPEGA